jgi:hypothetical protein
MSRAPCLRCMLMLAVIALAPGWAGAQVGEITHLSGATVARGADGRTRILSVKSTVNEGDLVATADNTYVRIKFSDNGEMVLRPNSQLKIDAYSFDAQKPAADNVLFSLIKGGMRSVTGLLARRNPSSYRLAAPTATIGIRGTHYGALVCNNDCGGISGPGGGTPANGLHIDVSDGVIVVTTRAGAVEFRIGEFGYVASQNTLPVLVPPSQGTRVDLPPQVLTQTIVAGSAIGRVQDSECRVQ